MLTIGFARRVPSYKRLTLMLRDPDRLRALLLDPDQPVQIVIAGKSHPADDGGKQLIAQMVQFADDPAVRHRIAFLPDYDIAMAKYLYWGVDVWLNNPLRPLEACGTSGMKAALNGALNLSIRDGWWDEWYDGENGWAIPSADGISDPDRRDDLEAHALYELIEKSVASRFYDRNAKNVPTRWIQMVRHTLRTLGPKVLATRMLRDYVRTLYAPAAASAARVTADGFAGAKELAAWRERVLAAWPGVRVLYVDSQLPGEAQVGQRTDTARRGRAERVVRGRRLRRGGVRTGRHGRSPHATRPPIALTLADDRGRDVVVRGGGPARPHRLVRLHGACAAEERPARRRRRNWEW